MATEFSFENVFRAPSTLSILSAYFDPAHLATQDKQADLVDRVVVEDVDGPVTRKTTWTVRAQKPLPLFVRPFVTGGRLSYREAMIWRKADDAIDLTVTPEILGGRVQVAATYTLTKIGEGQILRRYAGTITVNISLISGKAERGILAEFEQAMPIMTKCTQDWLTANPARP
ncbi:MAG: DUF2505 family protein [Proteobacteria bacterium]|nr:DUF2505 family protein [Pseudomonadota bacterium]